MIAAFVAAGIGVVTFTFYRKQHQLNGLMESFKLLNSVDHRKAREQVYTLFKIYQEKKDLGIFLSNNGVEIVVKQFQRFGFLDVNITGDGKIMKGTFYENRDGTDKDHFAIMK